MNGPQGMYDMTGWEPIECSESDQIRDHNRIKVASSLTDPDGTYSSGVVFSEWWTVEPEEPLLRDYRFADETCTHYRYARALLPKPDDEQEAS